MLLAILVSLLLTRGHLLGGLFKSFKRLPKDYDEGKKRIDDPASVAKPVNEPRDSERDRE